MKKLILKGNGNAAVEEAPVPGINKKEVLIKVNTSAICGSERMVYMMDKPYLVNLGHELSGTVVEACETEHIKTGDRVSVNIIKGCGECFYCKNGYRMFCKKISYVFSGHAEYVAMPEECCLKLPDNMSFEDGVLLGGDTIGVAYRCLSKIRVMPKTLIFVSGAGPVGLGVITLLKFMGCFVVVSEFNEYRRKYAKDKLMADVVINPAEKDVKNVLDELTQGLGPEFVIECSGATNAQQQALNLVRCQGTVVFAGENHSEVGICPSEQIIHKEINITGAFYFTPGDFIGIVDLFNRGLKPGDIVSHRMKGSEAPEAFKLFFSEGNTGKVLLSW